MKTPIDRDEARAIIEKIGVTTENVTQDQIKLLMGFLKSSFKSSPNYKGTMRLKERKPVKFLNMKTCSWDKRECISFNTDGFIGFAGWADNNNIKPILKAVGEWVEALKVGV
jgi:hypothetical protein